MCDCTGSTCPAIDSKSSTSACAVGSYAIKTSTGGFVCLKFKGTLTTLSSDDVARDRMVQLTGDQLKVTIDNGQEVTYEFGTIATTNGHTEILGLTLGKSAASPSQGIFFSACGPLIVETGIDRKRALTATDIQALSVGKATLVVSSGTAVGDPHLAGPNGIKLDVYGKPAANYSLVVAPSFEINMQLANRGPELRYMTAMSVLYRGTSFTIAPWTLKTKRAELIAHFESLGAKVSFEGAWRIKIEICAAHTLEFEAHHTVGTNINYLNFAMTVPGCHDAYGGLLGQTYQCKYATEKFEWSRAREEAFRVPTLETPSGAYSATTSCANEDEYRGEVIRGSSVGGGNSTLEMTAAQQERRRRL